MEKNVNDKPIEYLTVEEHKEYAQLIDSKFDKINRHIKENFEQTKKLSQNIDLIAGSVKDISNKIDNVTEKIDTKMEATADKISSIDRSLNEKLELNKENTDTKIQSQLRESDLRFNSISSNLTEQVKHSLAPIADLRKKVDEISNKKEASTGQKIVILTAIIGGIATIIASLIGLFSIN